jgi:hypothetical protein
MPTAAFTSLLTNPTPTLIGGFTLAILLILFDTDTVISVNIPGPRRITAAAVVAIGASVVYVLGRHGVTGLFDQLASSTIGLGLIGVFLAFLFGRMDLSI